MRLPFNEAKATQAAARLLKLARGKLQYFRLIKLLYLLDRESLLDYGRPITTDRYENLPHGPIVSHIYDDLIIGAEPGIWNDHISRTGTYQVRLVKDPGNGELSLSQERLIGKVFKKFGNKDREWLDWYCHHELPEWKNPGTRRRLDLPIRDILKAGGKTDEATEETLSEIESLAVLQSMRSPE
jgi:uncharacterized phage-associated protein